MRRALIGIVPDEILNRKRKAFIARAPLVGISEDWHKLAETTQHMVASSLGIVDRERLLAVLEKGRRGEVVPTVPLMRTIFVEDWLRRSRLMA